MRNTFEGAQFLVNLHGCRPVAFLILNLFTFIFIVLTRKPPRTMQKSYLWWITLGGSFRIVARRFQNIYGVPETCKIAKHDLRWRYVSRFSATNVEQISRGTLFCRTSFFAEHQSVAASDFIKWEQSSEHIIDLETIIFH